jgi:hypothetical protein
MSYVTTATEYIDIDGVPMATPAWIATDLSELNDGPENRGENLIIPRRPGTIFRSKIRDAKIVNIPIVIFGDRDAEGNTHADPRRGLIDNINALKKALTTPNTPNDNARLLTYHRASGDVEALVQTSPKLDISPIGPTAASAVITIEIPAGTLRSTTNTVITQSVGADTTFTINAAGAGTIFGVTYNIPGAANSVTITNNTTGAGITLGSAVTTGLVINTVAYTAFDGATNKSGVITTTGTPFWVPLEAGANELRIQRPSASTATATITFKAVWL